MEVINEKTPEWTCSEVLRLIREYGNRPALWDPDCEDYKNRFRKHHKWLELAAIFKCSKLEVERKMKILNSQYRRERLKAIRMKKAGMTHRVTWYGYKAFSFMNQQLVRYRNRHNLMAEPIKEENTTEEPEEDFNASETQLIPFLDDDESSRMQENQGDMSETPDYIHVNEISSEVVENIKNDNHKNEIRENSPTIVKMKKETDEWALFGEMVAHVFRKLPDERTRCIVKHKINTVLYEAELASYDNAS